jgi:UDP-N-acetylmuramoyl-L-alanyl-D-glutamate--2,6-diaminopimelate ligase
MKLKLLLQDLKVQIKGKKDLEITGISSHSKQVGPGNLFIARKGMKTDGTLFIEEAIQGGAAAILTDLYNPFLEVTQVIVEYPKEISSEALYFKQLEALIAKRFYKDPSDALFLVGITGTNGKTTTSYLIKHVLEESKGDCGLIGTIESIVGDHRFPSSLTTPDVITVNKYLSEMVRYGSKSAVMEVTSHALTQQRVEGIHFDVAVFTNLTQDHLDYHKTMEQYGMAKALLFKQLSSSGVAIMNRDDPSVDLLVKDMVASELSYALENSQADLIAKQIKLSPKGMSFEVYYQNQKEKIEIVLVGRFNVYNCLAAIGVALIKGMTLSEIAKKLKTFKGVSGRLEKIPNQKHLHAYVDFAHTDQAIQNVLVTLREFTKGKIFIVLGCGGDRDKEKRPKMGTMAEKHADQVILTSDNPRSEDPLQIIQEMLGGIKDKQKCLVEVDRKKAIERALSLASKEDIVLIAGRGHEQMQIFQDKAIPLSDREVVEQYVAC